MQKQYATKKDPRSNGMQESTGSNLVFFAFNYQGLTVFRKASFISVNTRLIRKIVKAGYGHKIGEILPVVTFQLNTEPIFTIDPQTLLA